jgi:hypothetical protein
MQAQFMATARVTRALRLGRQSGEWGFEGSITLGQVMQEPPPLSSCKAGIKGDARLQRDP